MMLIKVPFSLSSPAKEEGNHAQTHADTLTLFHLHTDTQSGKRQHILRPLTDACGKQQMKNCAAFTASIKVP